MWITKLPGFILICQDLRVAANQILLGKVLLQIGLFVSSYMLIFLIMQSGFCLETSRHENSGREIWLCSLRVL